MDKLIMQKFYSWLREDICKNDIEIESKFIHLYEEDILFLKELHKQLRSKVLYKAQELITNFFYEKKLTILSCGHCKKVHLISEQNFDNEECINCNQPLNETALEEFKTIMLKKKMKNQDFGTVSTTDPYILDRNNRIKSLPPNYVMELKRREKEKDELVMKYGAGYLSTTKCEVCEKTLNYCKCS